MQTLSDIKAILGSVQRRPVKAFGQNFLIDGNLMAKLLELADVPPDATVLEIGPGTGSLTEELLVRARRVVAVEIDDFLAGILQQRLSGRANFTLLHRDVLAGKHQIAPEVLAAVAGELPLHLVANLPYNVAVPVVLNCLLLSWEAVHRSMGEGQGRAIPTPPPRGEGCKAAPRFDRLTFTVQKELAERFFAGSGSDAYGPASVIAGILTRATPGRVLPPGAFWPPPKVHSQMLRLDFDAAAAEALRDAGTLQMLLQAVFTQRRKTLASATKAKNFPFPHEVFLSALTEAGISSAVRPEEVSPAAFAALANLLARPVG